MKTLTQLKQAMNAPMYRELTGRELMLYKTGFKNGYRMSLQQNKAKIEGQLFRLKLKQQKIEEDKKINYLLKEKQYLSMCLMHLLIKFVLDMKCEEMNCLA